MTKKFCVLLLMSFINVHAASLRLDVSEEAWPPYSFYNDKSNKGIMVEVLENLIADENLDLKISFLPENRSRRELDLCTIDAKPKAMEWVKDPKKYLWTDTVVVSQDVIIIRKIGHYKHLKELQGKVIGTVRGYSYPKLEKDFDNAKIIRADANSTFKMLEMLAKGHTDAAVTNKHVFQWYQKKYALLANELTVTNIVIDQVPYRFQFCPSPRWKNLLARLNKRLNQMKQSGKLEKILNRYQ